MASTTATAPTTRTPTGRRRLAGVRTALASRVRQGVAMASAARNRLRIPALTIAGLGCFAAAWFQLGLFAGLLATSVSVFVYQWLTAPEPDSSKR